MVMYYRACSLFLWFVGKWAGAIRWFDLQQVNGHGQVSNQSRPLDKLPTLKSIQQQQLFWRRNTTAAASKSVKWAFDLFSRSHILKCRGCSNLGHKICTMMAFIFLFHTFLESSSLPWLRMEKTKGENEDEVAAATTTIIFWCGPTWN